MIQRLGRERVRRMRVGGSVPKGTLETPKTFFGHDAVFAIPFCTSIMDSTYEELANYLLSLYESCAIAFWTAFIVPEAHCD